MIGQLNFEHEKKSVNLIVAAGNKRGAPPPERLFY
jgi:hypothetical protein